MRWQIVAGSLAISFALTSHAAQAASDQNTVSVAIVLDCSKSMSEPLPIAKDAKPASDGKRATRLDAAKDVLKKSLIGMAADGDYQVGLWLFGHRLAWEQGPQPGVVDQTTYLAQTNGFASLKDLLPGDDVERVRSPMTLGADDVDILSFSLSAVQPWGDAPLYLAVTKALDESAGTKNISHKGLVVITDGGNHQWLPRHEGTTDNVLKAYYRRRMPIHVIAIGAAADATAVAELTDLGSRSGGTFKQVETSVALAKALDEALKTIAGEEPEAPAESGDKTASVSTDTQTASVIKPASNVEAVPPKKDSQIRGVVSFNGKEVKGATVTVAGANLPSVKTDRSGAFTIKDVPPGSYQLLAEGIARNKIRTGSTNVTVGAPPKAPPIVDIELK